MLCRDNILYFVIHAISNAEIGPMSFHPLAWDHKTKRRIRSTRWYSVHPTFLLLVLVLVSTVVGLLQSETLFDLVLQGLFCYIYGWNVVSSLFLFY